jgi:hypothetical protein
MAQKVYQGREEGIGGEVEEEGKARGNPETEEGRGRGTVIDMFKIEGGKRTCLGGGLYKGKVRRFIGLPGERERGRGRGRGGEGEGE